MTGKMDQRIRIYRYKLVADSEGQQIPDPILVATLWAAAAPVSGREFEMLKSISSEISRKFTTNYRLDIDVLMKAVWRGATWNIHDVQQDEDYKQYMAIYVSKVK